MFIKILKVNEKNYKENKKEIRKGVFIPDCFKNENQYDRWFNETFKTYKRYHLREENKPELQHFENLDLLLEFH